MCVWCFSVYDFINFVTAHLCSTSPRGHALGARQLGFAFGRVINNERTCMEQNPLDFIIIIIIIIIIITLPTFCHLLQAVNKTSSSSSSPLTLPTD